MLNMEFINRKLELSRLDRVANQLDGGVIVLWGRRRVGKTRLLLEWTKKHKGIYYTADESAASLQIKYFAAALEPVLPGFASVDYPDWQVFLKRLAKEAMSNNWRGPLVIDELPYLISVSPEFPSILQKFLDHDAKEAKLTLALCGSSQRMMQGAILNANAPLFGRAQEILKLSPISAGYLGDALHLNSPREIVETYAIWGGIPRYWELVQRLSGSLLEKIDQLVLDPMGPLNDEPNRLLLEEIPPAITLKPLLDAIGLGAHRLSEIAAKIGQPATALSRPMQRLIELDLVKREIPFQIAEVNTKKTLYKIKDPFLRFWFETVAPRRSYFAQASPVQRKAFVKERLHPLFSELWEELCRVCLPNLTSSWGVPCNPGARYWENQGNEWDVVSDSLDGKFLLIGEAKWLKKTPSVAWVYKTLEALKAKGVPKELLERRQKRFILFLAEKPLHLTLPEDCKVVDAAEVLGSLKSYTKA